MEGNRGLSPSPLLSPTMRNSNSTPQLQAPLNIGNYMSGQSPSLQSMLLQQLGAQSRFVLPGQQMIQTP